MKVCVSECISFGRRVAGPVCVPGSRTESGPWSTR